MINVLLLLGLESSCDDTAAAVLRVPGTDTPDILSSVVYGQTALHKSFGGVVPELAARAHTEKMDLCIREALYQASVLIEDLDAVAVTAGPGLIGGVMSGVMYAKGICAATGLPLIGVNHLAGHALTPLITEDIRLPYLMLLVSGGHCQFLIVHSTNRFTRLGGTIDDAPGESFDKVARLLGLDQPGGPAVEVQAKSGDTGRFAFPRPMLDRPDCNMSFSGLKTAVLRARDQLVADQGGLVRQDIRDICASFQTAVTEVFVAKTRRAIGLYLETVSDTPWLAVAGGVAANATIRTALEFLCRDYDMRFAAPPLSLCTDNAAMIAFAGAKRLQMGDRDGLDLMVRPRWPLDETKPAMLGSGKKGSKA